MREDGKRVEGVQHNNSGQKMHKTVGIIHKFPRSWLRFGDLLAKGFVAKIVRGRERVVRGGVVEKGGEELTKYKCNYQLEVSSFLCVQRKHFHYNF